MAAVLPLCRSLVFVSLLCQLPDVSFQSSVQLGHGGVYCDSYSHSSAVLPLT